MKRVLVSLGVVLAVCAGVRVAAFLIEPVLPLLGAMFMIVLVMWWALAGPRYGGK